MTVATLQKYTPKLSEETIEFFTNELSIIREAHKDSNSIKDYEEYFLDAIVEMYDEGNISEQVFCEVVVAIRHNLWYWR